MVADGTTGGMELGGLLEDALAEGEDARLRAALSADSGLPGPRLNLRLVWAFAGAVGEVVRRPRPPVTGLERLLDGWAGLSDGEAPVSRPEVILPCAAVAAYGVAAVVRPDWFDDEIAKLRRAAGDTRWRVREVVAQALQHMLDADWARTAQALRTWAADDDALVVRAAVAAVAEPRLLHDPARAGSALEVQRQGAETYRRLPADRRRTDAGLVLRQALGFTIGVVVAATGDFTVLEELAASDDPDLRRVVHDNLRRARLRRWPDRVTALRQLLG